MSRFVKIKAKQIRVLPALVAGAEHQGPIYLSWEDSPAVGAQCPRCHTVVWCDATTDPILNERKPSDVQDSGPEYRRYYQSKVERFLASLPTCPECHGNCYDRFITNVEFPRFKDGKLFEPSASTKLLDLDPLETDLWYRGEA